VLDAGFIALHYSGNKNAAPYLNRILSRRAKGFISEVNLAEFYYRTVQKLGFQTAEIWYLQTRQAGFEVVAPNEEITREAAIWKVKRSEISLADCFALATLKFNAEVLLTTDSVLARTKGVRSVHINY
jgi:predicted nucleic acid-binding protein